MAHKDEQAVGDHWELLRRQQVDLWLIAPEDLDTAAVEPPRVYHHRAESENRGEHLLRISDQHRLE